MAKENAKKFEELLTGDKDLQAKLRAAMDSYTGDKKNEKAVFDAVLVPLAEETGLPFTYEEAREYAMENRELSLDEGNAAAGGSADVDDGTSWCFYIGGGNDPDAEDCGAFTPETGFGACAFIGVGFAKID